MVTSEKVVVCVAVPVKLLEDCMEPIYDAIESIRGGELIHAGYPRAERYARERRRYEAIIEQLKEHISHAVKA